MPFQIISDQLFNYFNMLLSVSSCNHSVDRLGMFWFSKYGVRAYIHLRECLLRPSDAPPLRQSMSAGHPWVTTGIPVGKPTGMETCRSESLVIAGLHGSGFLFWVLRVLATSTCETKVLFIYFTNLIYYLLYYTFWCLSAWFNIKCSCANSPTTSKPL